MTKIARLNVPEGMTSLGVRGVDYVVKDGTVDVDPAHIEDAVSHGCSVAEVQPVFVEKEPDGDPAKSEGDPDPAKDAGEAQSEIEPEPSKGKGKKGKADQ